MKQGEQAAGLPKYEIETGMSQVSCRHPSRGEIMNCRVRQAGIIFILTLAVGPLLAQTSTPEVEDEAPLKPGLHLSADHSDGSVLARAARMRGSVVISGDEEETIEVVPEARPEQYIVQEGDTLWDICERLFDDSYVWPRIWSYNPSITNPNWIYPGEVIRLTDNASEEVAVAPQEVSSDVASMPSMSKGTLLIRNRAFIDKDGLKKSGQIVGAHKEIKWLAQYDEAYVHFPEASPKPGDVFSAFDIVREVDVNDEETPLGKLVEIKGEVKVTSFDQKSHIARVVIEEASEPLPRGTPIGPVYRKLNMIPAVRNNKTIKGELVAFLDPVVLAANHQVVFVNRGEKHGVRDGNRFFAVEQRDGLRRLNEQPNDMDGYPVEVIAEMRVIETRRATATCLITSAVRELEVGQKVEMREGY